MKGKDYKKITAKTLLSLMLLFGAFIQKTYAQDAVGYIGITAAPLLTGLSSDRSSIKSVFGFSAGITPEIKIGENFGIELDLLITEKGGKRNYVDSLGLYNGTWYFNYNLNYNFMYAEGDLLFKWYIPIDHNAIIPYDAPGHHSFLYLEAGPYYSDMVSYSSSGTYQQYEGPLYGSKDTTEGSFQGSYSKSNKSPTLNSSSIVTTDIGATVGLGVIFPVTHRGLLSFEVRYSKGLTSIDNGEFGHYELLPYSKAVPVNVIWSYPANVTTYDVGLYITYKVRILGGGE